MKRKAKYVTIPEDKWGDRNVFVIPLEGYDKNIEIPLPPGTTRFTVNFNDDMVIRIYCVTPEGTKLVEYNMKRELQSAHADREIRQRMASHVFDIDAPDAWI